MSSDWFFIGTASAEDMYYVPAMLEPELILPVFVAVAGDEADMKEAIPTAPHITAKPKKELLLKFPPVLLSIIRSSTLNASPSNCSPMAGLPSESAGNYPPKLIFLVGICSMG